MGAGRVVAVCHPAAAGGEGDRSGEQQQQRQPPHAPRPRERKQTKRRKKAKTKAQKKQAARAVLVVGCFFFLSSSSFLFLSSLVCLLACLRLCVCVQKTPFVSASWSLPRASPRTPCSYSPIFARAELCSFVRLMIPPTIVFVFGLSRRAGSAGRVVLSLGRAPVRRHRRARHAKTTTRPANRPCALLASSNPPHPVPRPSITHTYM